MSWLRRAVRPAGQAKKWTSWRLPALVLLRFRPDPTSATRIRAADPAWHRRYANARPIPISAPFVPNPPQRTDMLQP
jgi:nicotinate-nucleotide adenylyltransferase